MLPLFLLFFILSSFFHSHVYFLFCFSFIRLLYFQSIFFTDISFFFPSFLFPYCFLSFFLSFFLLLFIYLFLPSFLLSFLLTAILSFSLTRGGENGPKTLIDMTEKESPLIYLLQNINAQNLLPKMLFWLK